MRRTKGTIRTKPYEMQVGPEGYLPPAVSTHGVVLPSKGEGLVMGKIVPDQQAIEVRDLFLLENRDGRLLFSPARVNA